MSDINFIKPKLQSVTEGDRTFLFIESGKLLSFVFLFFKFFFNINFYGWKFLSMD